MNNHDILDIDAWQSMDSRGRPTVTALVTLADGSTGRATAPSGASTGTHEAHELRDGSPEWLGQGVGQAVRNVREDLRTLLVGTSAADQHAVDGAMRDLDGTANLSRLGANAILAVSLANAGAVARYQGRELWQHLSETAGRTPSMPMPMVNIFSGGAHAAGLIDIQDVLVIPCGATSFAQAIEWCWRVRRATSEVAAELGLPVNLVADEGGIAGALSTNVEAVDAVARGIERAGFVLGDDVSIALDVAATNFVTDDGRYAWASENRTLSSEELVETLADWMERYPIISIEDPVAEDDWLGWARATDRLGSVQLVGDDLFVTNADRLRQGIEHGIGNSILVKVNQNGTLSGSMGVFAAAQAHGYTTVVSARSGETEESWLSDLAVGLGGDHGQIKVGSTTRSERTAKWNRLLEIEHRFGLPFATFPDIRA